MAEAFPFMRRLPAQPRIARIARTVGCRGIRAVRGSSWASCAALRVFLELDELPPHLALEALRELEQVVAERLLDVDGAFDQGAGDDDVGAGLDGLLRRLGRAQAAADDDGDLHRALDRLDHGRGDGRRRAGAGLEVDEAHAEVLRGEGVADGGVEVVAADEVGLPDAANGAAGLHDEVAHRDGLDPQAVDDGGALDLLADEEVAAAAVEEAHEPDGVGVGRDLRGSAGEQDDRQARLALDELDRAVEDARPLRRQAAHHDGVAAGVGGRLGHEARLLGVLLVRVDEGQVEGAVAQVAVQVVLHELGTGPAPEHGRRDPRQPDEPFAFAAGGSISGPLVRAAWSTRTRWPPSTTATASCAPPRRRRAPRSRSSWSASTWTASSSTSAPPG